MLKVLLFSSQMLSRRTSTVHCPHRRVDAKLGETWFPGIPAQSSENHSQFQWRGVREQLSRAGLGETPNAVAANAQNPQQVEGNFQPSLLRQQQKQLATVTPNQPLEESVE